MWRLAKQAFDRLDHRNITLDRTGKWLRAVRQARLQATLTDQLPSLESGLDEYQRNIEAIIREARQRTLRIVFLTQPFSWKETMPEKESSLLWWGYRPDGKFYTTGALARAMESYNRRLMEVCARVGVECIDMASRIPRDFGFFFDDMHYTEAGAQRFATELAGELNQHPPFAR